MMYIIWFKSGQNLGLETKIGPNMKLCLNLALTTACPRAPSRLLSERAKGSYYIYVCHPSERQHHT